MDEDELNWRKKSLEDIFMYYCRLYLDRQASGILLPEEMEYIMIQIDLILDWYIDLKYNKEK